MVVNYVFMYYLFFLFTLIMWLWELIRYLDICYLLINMQHIYIKAKCSQTSVS